MLNEAQQQRLWEELIAAETRANYFGDLCGHYRTVHRACNWITLVLSSGAALTFVSKTELSSLAPFLAVAVAGVSAYTLVLQNQERAMNCADLHLRWNKLAHEYQALWENIHTEDAAERLRQLTEKSEEISKAGTSFPYRKRRMLKWQRHVEAHHGIKLAA